MNWRSRRGEGGCPYTGSNSSNRLGEENAGSGMASADFTALKSRGGKCTALLMFCDTVRSRNLF